MPCTYNRQPPFPSQVPSCPQVACVLALQSDELSGLTPAGVEAHSPKEVGRLHDLQVSPQAEVQQTPSAQKRPVWHSLSHEQGSALPLVLLPAPAGHVLDFGASVTSALWASDRLPTSPAPSAWPELTALLQPARPAIATASTTTMRPPPHLIPDLLIDSALDLMDCPRKFFYSFARPSSSARLYALRVNMEILAVRTI